MLLYEGVPEKCVSKFANCVRLERDSQIVEAYVDFKTELKTKHEGISFDSRKNFLITNSYYDTNKCPL